jgi:hypothetical protein
MSIRAEPAEPYIRVRLWYKELGYPESLLGFPHKKSQPAMNASRVDPLFSFFVSMGMRARGRG